MNTAGEEFDEACDPDQAGTSQRKPPPHASAVSRDRQDRRWGSIVKKLTNRISRDLPLLTVLGLITGYAVLLSYLSIMKYYTFNATYGDLGINNHVIWLLSHGGPSEYYASHFNTLYGIPWDQSALFLFVPFYLVYPTPYTLLALQSIFIAAAALPLFYLSRILTHSQWLAVLVSAAYLGYFPLTSANLFDFHFYTLAPLFYLLMCLFWIKGQEKRAVIAGALTASINPLMLIMAGFFFIYTVGCTFVETNPRDSLLSRMVATLRASRIRVIAILAFGILLIVYAALNLLGGSGYQIGGGSGLSPLQVITYQINEKLVALLFLFGAVAFLPLFDRVSLFLLLPYIGFVVYSTFQADWTTFGDAFMIMAVGPVFFGVSRVLASESAQDRAGEGPEHQPGTATPELSSNARWRRSRGAKTPELSSALMATTIVFVAIYFPISPLNADVTGGYFSGNHDYPGITTVTPQVQFLWKVIDLIPANGAVLTQNDIPQVSGRLFYQIDDNYNPSIPYNYILADTSFSYFTDVSYILPFIESGLTNKTFGILASGLGAILLERNYTGPPALYVPATQDYPGSSLSLYSGVTNGTEIVNHELAYSFWYGPGISLLPGRYSVTFNLSSNTTEPRSAFLITLDVTAASGSDVLATQNLYAGNFTNPNEFNSFRLNFSIANYTTGIEFRGMFPSGLATLTLRDLFLDQISPGP